MDEITREINRPGERRNKDPPPMSSKRNQYTCTDIEGVYYLYPSSMYGIFLFRTEYAIPFLFLYFFE